MAPGSFLTVLKFICPQRAHIKLNLGGIGDGDRGDGNGDANGDGDRADDDDDRGVGDGDGGGGNICESNFIVIVDDLILISGNL